ncbi:MAG: DoxX family protein [Caulobacteraceae bacterium]
MNALNAAAPKVLSLLRIIAALLFIEHGTMKMFAFPGPQPGLGAGLPPILILAAWIEIVGGVLVLFGLATRWAALVLSGEMAVAYFSFHLRMGPWPGLNHGGEAILFCWIFLYLFFTGGGTWSLDRLF